MAAGGILLRRAAKAKPTAVVVILAPSNYAEFSRIPLCYSAACGFATAALRTERSTLLQNQKVFPFLPPYKSSPALASTSYLLFQYPAFQSSHKYMMVNLRKPYC